MEQKDWLLREIEKIGTVISAFRQMIFGGKENLSITFEEQVEAAKGLMFNEMNFNIDAFLDLNAIESDEYISRFVGFTVENIELLAACMSQIGFHDKSDHSKKYLEKALQLYELCDLKSKTYSLERDISSKAIKNALYPNF